MRNLIFVSLFIICTFPVCSQQQWISAHDDTLALVDRHPVTSRDLFERISMMPYEDKLTDRNFNSVKRKAVESLVGEYLLSQVNVPEDSSDWRKRFSETVLERMFMRDALFKHEIREKVLLTDEEMTEGMKMFARRKVILAVQVPENEQGEQFVKEWRKDRQKKTAHEQILGRFPFRSDTLLIALGSIDSVLENAAFRLKDPSEIIGPISSDAFGRIAIAWLRDETNPAAKDISFSDRRKKVSDILRDRKESQLQRRFFDALLRGEQMNADSALFRSVASQFRSLILRDTIARKVPSGFRYLPTDLYELMQQFKTELDSPIVRGTFGSIRLGIFLEYLYYYDFTVPSLKRRSFTVSFFQMLRAIAEGEMAAAEAEKKGLRYDADVRRDAAVWNNHNHSRTAEYRIADTVRAEDWEPYWSLWRRSSAVIEENLSFNVQEVLLQDSAAAASVKQQVFLGMSMDSIARTMTIRKEWKTSGGISGWFSFKQYPELSQKLMLLSSNTLSGPTRLKEGFSVIKILGRKITGNSPYVDSLLQRELLRMRTKRQLSAVSASIAVMAQNHHVEFYNDRIDRADAADINMLTRRIIGFGGRINAAPYLIPQWEWVELWRKLQKINP